MTEMCLIYKRTIYIYLYTYIHILDFLLGEQMRKKNGEIFLKFIYVLKEHAL